MNRALNFEVLYKVWKVTENLGKVNDELPKSKSNFEYVRLILLTYRFK